MSLEWSSAYHVLQSPPREDQQSYQPQFDQRSSPRAQTGNVHTSPGAYSRHSLGASNFQTTSSTSEPLPTSHTAQHDPLPATNTQEDAEEMEAQGTIINDKWVHRDKLAEIEKKELEEIGARLGLPLRAGSISGIVQDPREGLSELDNGQPSSKRPRIDTSDAFSGSDEDFDSPPSPNGMRSHSRTLSAARAGKSRIPISKSSPLARTAPFSSSPITSDSPFQQRLSNNDPNQSWRNSLTDSPMISPSQSRKPSTATPKNATNTNRDFSGTRTTSLSQQNSIRARTVSNAAKRNSLNRPSMTLDRNDRPRTPVNRPEGDAPWLATMFKPDPLLPPDQQMLPTHAKKLALQRGERVLTNEELLEREIAEAARAEGGWMPPQDKAETALPPVQEKEERAGSRLSARPSIKRFFSRNSMKAKSQSRPQSQIGTPREERVSAELVAGPPYRGEPVVQQQQQPHMIGGGVDGHDSMGFVQGLQQQSMRNLQSKQSFPSSQRNGRRTGDVNGDELEEWPLASPQRTQLPSRRESGDEKGVYPQHPTNMNLKAMPQTQGVPGGEKTSTAAPPQIQKKEGEKKKEGGCGGCCVVM